MTNRPDLVHLEHRHAAHLLARLSNPTGLVLSWQTYECLSPDPSVKTLVGVGPKRHLAASLSEIQKASVGFIACFFCFSYLFFL